MRLAAAADPRARLGLWARRLGPVAAALDARPTGLVFPDGATRVVPHWLAADAAEWQGGPAASEIRGVVDAYTGGDVVDVGAWHGFYSLALAPEARRGDTIVSLKPDTKAYPVLLDVLAVASRLFPEVRFVALPSAAGDGEPAALAWPNGDAGPAAHPRVGGADVDGEPTLRVDDLAAGLALRPKLVKIDVEGAELDVLRGMPALLADGPALMIELHPWQDYAGLGPLLEGYERTDLSAKWGFTRTLWSRM